MAQQGIGLPVGQVMALHQHPDAHADIAVLIQGPFQMTLFQLQSGQFLGLGQGRLHHRGDSGRLQRFHQVGEGALAGGPIDEGAVVVAGQIDHRDVPGLVEQASQFQAAHVREFDIQDGQVHVAGSADVDGLLATGGADRFITQILQSGVQGRQAQGIVLDQQQAGSFL